MGKRFTLVELMIVVAIIGILAAIAIPSFHAMQIKARQAEIFPIVDGINVAAVAYFADTGQFASTGANPPGTPGKAPKPWNTSVTGWDLIDFAPDGDVRGQYWTEHGSTAAGPFATFKVEADLDGDAHFCSGYRSTDGQHLASAFLLHDIGFAEDPAAVF